ncbi:hypothetical protein AgCh_032796 [Apium graveolens]
MHIRNVVGTEARVFITGKSDTKLFNVLTICHQERKQITRWEKDACFSSLEMKTIAIKVFFPQFAEAKREEKARLKQEKKQAALDAKNVKQKKEQAAILAKLQAVKPTQQVSAQPSEIVESQNQVMQNEPPQTKKPRYKQRINRKLDFSDEEMEGYFPKESMPTKTQTSMPSVAHEEFKIDPSKNFYGEPIIPKDEPIDWDSLPIPKLNLPQFMKPKKTKTRAVKKVKPSTLRS